MLVDEIAAKVSKIFDVKVTPEDLIETLEFNENITIVKEIEIERQKLKDKTYKELEKVQRAFRDRADRMTPDSLPIATISEFYCNTLANEAAALIEVTSDEAEN